MAPVKPAPNRCFLLLVCFVASASVAQTNISATVGDGVTLPCTAPSDSIRVMWWSRLDQEPKHVLMYQDEHFDAEDQHPSFIGRVDLQDHQMKDGDVSLRLTNVMFADSGTYVCHVFMGDPEHSERTAEYISIINLSVLPVSDQRSIPADKSRASTAETTCGKRQNICYLMTSGLLLIGLGEFLIYCFIRKLRAGLQSCEDLVRAAETHLLELNRRLDASVGAQRPSAAVLAGETN